ncbi:MAG: hypothetical protein CL846_08000 [Crocinitomicaceae bacterium]|nr:hypothetical protein [Crocinitomicaceae bacterium]|tara:strand:- start:592 stop:1050 length:459 start_codon:yes stop_codon:yes gene_type:complete
MSEISLLSINEITEKINSLNKNSIPRWGKMSSPQMLKHCSKFIDLYLGKISVPFWYKYFGITIGKLFLRYISKKSPLETPRNIRTDKSLKITDENLDFDSEKKVLIYKLIKLHDINGQINHPIYGSMKSEKILFLIKHHTIHHLNQFNLIMN